MIQYRNTFSFQVSFFSFINFLSAFLINFSICEVFGKTISELYSEKKFEEIIKILSPKVESLKAQELIYLADSYSETKNHLLSIKVYNVVLSKNPSDLQVMTFIGREYIILEKYEDAKTILRSVLSKNSKFEPAYKQLISLYEKRKNRYELRFIYQDLVDKVKERSEYVIKLCELNTLDGIYDFSIKYCRRARQLDPSSPSPLINLGLTYKATQSLEQAEYFFKLASESFPKSSEAQMSLAEYYMEKNNFVDAFSYYSKVVQIDPHHLKGLLGVGLSGIEIQKYQEALAGFKQACKIDKKSVTMFRRAANQIRLQNNKQWLSQFEAGIDDCH